MEKGKKEHIAKKESLPNRFFMDRLTISPIGRLCLFSCLCVNIGVCGVVLYEIAPWLNVVAHEHGEYLICLGGVFYCYLFEQPIGWIHRRFPKLLRIHLSQTFISLCVNAFCVFVSVGIFIEKRLALCLVIAIFACLALISTLVKWRGRYVKVSLLYNLRHESIEQCHDQRVYMLSLIHISEPTRRS